MTIPLHCFFWLLVPEEGGLSKGRRWPDQHGHNKLFGASRIFNTPSPLHFPVHEIDAAFASGVFVLEGTFASPIEPFPEWNCCTGGFVSAFGAATC